MFVRSGTVCVARFGPGEAAVLNEVMLEVITLLSEGFDRADPVIERLFPDVYRDDAALSAEVPLEIAVSRRLGRKVGGAQAEGQRRGRNASDDHAHHRLPP